MKKVMLFLVLILTLTGYSPDKKSVIDSENKDIFIKGKLTFKDKNVPIIRFWIEGDKGNYSLILFEENGQTINNHVKNISNIVDTVFRENICSSLKYYILRENKIYFVYDFDNKEIFNIKGIKLFSLGGQVIKLIEEKTGGKISGYIVFANL